MVSLFCTDVHRGLLHAIHSCTGCSITCCDGTVFQNCASELVHEDRVVHTVPDVFLDVDIVLFPDRIVSVDHA